MNARDLKSKQIKGIVADVPKPTAMTPDECRKACKKAGLEYLPGYESRVLRYVITNESQDRYGDVVRVAGAKIDNYMKNPVVMMAHRHDMPPIGKTVDLTCNKQCKQIEASGLFLDGRTDMTGVSETAFKLAQSGAMPGCSIGFMPIKANRPQTAEERVKIGIGENGYEFLDWELLEWSVCSIPANPDALQLNALLRCIAEKTIDVDARDLFVLDRFKMLTTRQCLDVYVKVFGGAIIKTDDDAAPDEGQAPIDDIVPMPDDEEIAAMEPCEPVTACDLPDEQSAENAIKNNAPVLRPYPNEHACRIVDPAEFDEFRRGTRKHDGKEYSIIYGKKKADGKWSEQAYRYAKNIWTSDEARKHCDEHDGSFASAVGPKAIIDIALIKENMLTAMGSIWGKEFVEQAKKIAEIADLIRNLDARFDTLVSQSALQPTGGELAAHAKLTTSLYRKVFG
jgi:HK97 family phage prohead protease